jgi:putative ABC transport system permease protein
LSRSHGRCVATLFLVRSEARQREVAVRRALGADGAGIARYFLAESVLISLAAGAVGLALAWGAAQLLVAAFRVRRLGG